MICPECEKLGLKSMVFVGSSTITCLMYQHFYDEEGREHFHDPNMTTTHYSCSNGHSWIDQSRNKCWCEKEGENEQERST